MFPVDDTCISGLPSTRLQHGSTIIPLQFTQGRIEGLVVGWAFVYSDLGLIPNDSLPFSLLNQPKKEIRVNMQLLTTNEAQIIF